MPKSLSYTHKRTKRAKTAKKTWEARRKAQNRNIANNVDISTPKDLKPKLKVFPVDECPLQEQINNKNFSSGHPLVLDYPDAMKLGGRSTQSGPQPKEPIKIGKPDVTIKIEEKHDPDLTSSNSNSDDSDEDLQKVQEEQDRILQEVLGIERVPESASKVIKGLRIADLEYVMNFCTEYQAEHSEQCTLGVLRVHKEKRCGFESTITLRCDVCEYKTSVSTHM